LLELTQRFLLRQALPLKRGPGLDESGPLLLKLAFCLLACDSLPPELLLRRDDRGGLVSQAGPQLLDLLGPLLSLTLPDPRSLEGCAVPLELGASGDDLGLPRCRDRARPARSSRALRSASSRSTSVVLTLSTAEASPAAWMSCSGGRSSRASALYASHRSGDLRASTRASRASYCPRYQLRSASRR
jgi:hypothetical protein